LTGFRYAKIVVGRFLGTLKTITGMKFLVYGGFLSLIYGDSAGY
jgi:hypothetical protein